ncbi:uncharacterized protein PAC_10013 [Phialocephala subalpina]|uniref:Uncharacterized protein n=1 Tax=Phialocephala subalpina TaxID=576137 RepID=A0A1L7X528_9HELO|nr:uncharacterized protein PAC_10013 [Phialocephala subalpina]
MSTEIPHTASASVLRSPRSPQKRPLGRRYQPQNSDPPSWAEQHRINRALWRLQVFFDLKTAAQRSRLELWHIGKGHGDQIDHISSVLDYFQENFQDHFPRPPTMRYDACGSPITSCTLSHLQIPKSQLWTPWPAQDPETILMLGELAPGYRFYTSARFVLESPMHDGLCAVRSGKGALYHQKKDYHIPIFASHGKASAVENTWRRGKRGGLMSFPKNSGSLALVGRRAIVGRWIRSTPTVRVTNNLTHRPPALCPRRLRSQGLQSNPQRQARHRHQLRWCTLQVQHRKNGFLIEPGDWKAVANHLLELWTDEKLYEEMSSFAKISVSGEVGTVGNALSWFYLADKWANGKGIVPKGRWVNDLARDEASIPYVEGEKRFPRDFYLGRVYY